MLDALKRIVDDLFADTADEKGGESQLRLSTAVLALEILRADFEETDDEQACLRAQLGRHFSLSDKETAALIELAEAQVDDVTCLADFTRELNDHYGQEERARVLEMLWEISYADGVLDPKEEQLIRRIADLLYLPHSTYIRLRNRVEQRH